MKLPRLSPQTVQVLGQFAERPSAWHYGYGLSRATGLKSGTLYPILMRLAKHGLLETRWMTTEPGVPPRHTYRLTPKGVRVLRELPAKFKLRVRVRRPALSGSGA
ncbi:MAG TPA: PadR family transcriptional regulator [Candidatus Aquilonibacter sp.]|nr:PadR family transcriptional regulator [Candidatus Aquilonibacter sp.]